MAAIQDVAPKVLTAAADLEVPASGPVEYTSDLSGVSITLPEEAADPIVMEDEFGAVTIELPAEGELEDAGRGFVAYEHDDAFTTVPVVREDASVQITTVIDDASAPTRYDYEIGLPAGGYLAEEHGHIVLHEADGSWAGGVMPAWAVDANGTEVASHYEISGTTLTQVVDHTVDGVVYPVTADPYLGKALISTVVREAYENGYPRYNVFRTQYGKDIQQGWIAPGQIDGLQGPLLLQQYGWPEVVAKQSGVTARPSVRQQFDCHTIYAGTKNPYNLEAWRPSHRNWFTSPVQCNWSGGS